MARFLHFFNEELSLGTILSIHARTSYDVFIYDSCRCIFNAGSKKLPSLTSAEIRRIKQKDLVMNVYNNGLWGSYRHLPLQVAGEWRLFIYIISVLILNL